MSSSYEFEDPVSDKLQAVTNEEDEVALKVAVPQTLPEDGVVGMKSILKKVLKCLKKGGGGEEEEEEDDDDYEEEEEEEEGDDYDEEEEEEDDDDDYDEEEDDDVGIIGVYGMGGVGKTTLLDQIKEKLHREMKNDFDVVIWVVVSRDLQHDKIQQQIGEQIGLFDDKAWKHKNSVKKALVISNILKEKKFVLLMDDLWGRVDLTKVGVPLPSPENSSKIVFTTRSLQICSLMEADKLFKVTCLSDNDAWKLFKALVGDETLRSHREDSIARVCRECHGLPLALVSIGQTVRKKPPEEWDDLYRVLRGWTTSNSGLDDQLKKDIRDNLKLIRNNLKLSYDILQNDMFKSCFLYCCLFPTYLRIKKQDLIDYWIGEGFLDERLGAVQSRGHYIIDVFLSVCLLEQSGFDDSYVKMNYWIRDMSLWIASEIETEKGNCVFFHDIDNFKDDENLKKATRISFPPFEFNEEVMKKLPGPPTCPLLQTLFLIRNRSEVIRNAIRKDHYFNFMPSLKVLNLSLNSWLTELPPGILKLISLQHLDLSGTKIEKLPKELTVLKILKCLNLEETRSLSEIPRQLISEFSMLHVLRLRECGFMLKPNEDTVVSVSKEDGVEFNDAQLLIEELLYLKNLSMLSITLNNSHALQRLLSSNRLQSCIQSLRLQDLRHPKSIKVSLTDLKHLNTLEISNCEYLEELEVDFVGEAQDVRESPCSFYFLHEVIISKCRKLRELTWLILAPNLKHLRISNCAEMEEIINVGKLSECPELMGNVIPFSKLKFLTLKYLPKLRSIYWSVLPFPDLKELARTDCPMLLPLPPNLLNKVYVLPVEPSSVENPANRAKQVIASGGSGKSLEVPSNRDVSAKSAKLKIVIKLQVKSDKCRSKAMKIVAGEDGVMSVSWEGQDKDTMVVTGDGVDAVALTVKLSKKLGFAKLLSEEYVTSHYRKMTGGTGKSKVPSKRTYLPEMAEEAKAKGNAAFSAGNYSAAKRHFTDAIALAPTNHVLYSNRSAPHAFLHNYADALADAKKTVEIKPDWPKGYSRLGAAHLGLQNHAEAISAYKKGLANNEALKSGLADAQAAVRSCTPPSDNPLASAFSGPEMWTKLTADPSTRSFLQQPDFGKMMQEIQKNPNNLNLYLKDHRVMQALGVLLNVKLRGANGGDEMEMEQEFPNSSSSEPAREEKKPAPQAATEPEPEPMESTEEDREAKERKEKARREKEAGNAAYKKKDFDTAIDHYTKALELDDEDISYLTNRAAVYLEMGKYEECIEDCDKAVERGRELRADFKMVARALTRKGTALAKMAKCSKDYDLAIEIFQKALTEHRNPDTLKRLNDAEKAKKELEQQEFFDPKIADEEREKGNEYFKQQKYPEAVKHYTESLRRNPKDPRTYSNRAACYTKLGALPEGLKDAEKCIELDPTFSKGYTRKGAVQFFMKEYDKAIETYQEGLKHDPQNQELTDGVRRCVEQINKAGRGELSADELKERQTKGMQDPEIQNILSDPVMRQVLVDFQENPKSAQDHMKNPMVMNKIQKLINAGIVQIR